MPNLIVPHQQVVAGVAATLVWDYVDEEGEALEVEAPSVVTVGASTSDGTVVLADGTATTLDADVAGRYTAPLTSADTAAYDVLTVEWSIDGDLIATTHVEVRGPHLFTLAEARRFHRSLDSDGRYDVQDLVDGRAAVEAELEWICDRSFTPRFRRFDLNGTGERVLRLPVGDLRDVRSCTVDGTALTAGELADLVVYDSGRIERPVGDYWPAGQENLALAVVHGLDRAPQDLRDAALLRLREHLGKPTRGVAARSTQANANGVTMQLRPPEFETGNPLVDPVYRRYSRRVSATASADQGAGSARAYGRTVTFGPQGDPLFRFGRT